MRKVTVNDDAILNCDVSIAVCDDPDDAPIFIFLLKNGEVVAEAPLSLEVARLIGRDLILMAGEKPGSDLDEAIN